MNEKRRYRKPVAVEVVHKPQLTSVTIGQLQNQHITHTKLNLADRIRNAVGAPTDLSPKAVRAYLHGLRINLRNLANEVEKFDRTIDEACTTKADGEVSPEAVALRKRMLDAYHEAMRAFGNSE